MANLENVVQQLKAERDRAQKTLDQLDAALKARLVILPAHPQ